MGTPAVSVLLPIYNGTNYMEQSIRSVLAQTMPDFELLIVDDCSRDGTAELARSFDDPRIRFSRNEQNRGLFYNLNRMIEASTAPLVKLWSHDDVMQPRCLEQGVRFAREQPELGYFYCAADSIDADGAVIAVPPYDSTPIVMARDVADYYSLLHGSLSGNIATFFFPRWVFADVGLFREDWISADLEMQVRIQKKHAAGRIPEVLVQVRHHAKQWSMASDSFVRFLREGLQIHDTLAQRVVHVHGKMSEAEARSVHRKLLADNYFHGAVRRLVRGQPELAKELVRLVGSRESAILGLLWLRDLPGRVKRRTERAARKRELRTHAL